MFLVFGKPVRMFVFRFVQSKAIPVPVRTFYQELKAIQQARRATAYVTPAVLYNNF